MKQAQVLTKVETRKVIKVCELTRHADRNKLIVHLSFLSGMRAVEIANLRVMFTAETKECVFTTRETA
ncbi:MAG: hypothetical protein OSB31_10390 [Paracoccaceae bacterium]|nr:hypothetical protein [Paracoccaceae bacterium]